MTTHLDESPQSHQHLPKQGTWVLRTRLSFTFCKRSVKIESSCEVGRNHQNGGSLDIHGHLLRFGIWTSKNIPQKTFQKNKTFEQKVYLDVLGLINGRKHMGNWGSLNHGSYNSIHKWIRGPPWVWWRKPFTPIGGLPSREWSWRPKFTYTPEN